MEQNWHFRIALAKIAVIVVTVVSFVLMTAMMVYAGNKVIILNDDETIEFSNDETVAGSKWKYDLEATDSDKCFVLPVSEDINEGKINTFVRYDRNEITITLNSDNDTYYHNNPPFGNFNGISEAYGEFDGENIYITVKTNEHFLGEFEYSNIIYGGEFTMTLTPLSDIDVPIVLIDACHGGNYMGTTVGEVVEKNVLLNIAKAVEAHAVNKPYKVVLLRSDDTYIKTEDKVKIIEALAPDYYIGLELSSDPEDVKKFGMYAVYNSGYYRKGLQNVSFADEVLRSVCTKVSNRANGLMTVSDSDVILMTMDIPGTVLYAGYMSNTEECELLSRVEYTDKIGEGIVDAIDNVLNVEVID